MRPDHRNGFEHHHEIADALQSQQKNAARRATLPAARASRGHPKQLRGSEARIGQPDEHSFLPIGNLKMFEHYRISALSIMTPSARVSDPPRTVRGIHVEL